MTLRIVRLLTVLLACPLMLSAQTNIAIPAASGGGIKLVLPNRLLGVTMDPSETYGPQQITANLLAANNFAPQTWNQTLVCASGTTTTAVSNIDANNQQNNFWQGAQITWETGALTGQSSTVTSSVGGIYPGGPNQSFVFSPAFTAGCSSGDMAFLHCNTPLSTCAGARNLVGLYYSGGASAAWDTTDLSPSSTSLQALEFIAPGSATATLPLQVDATLPALFGPTTWIHLNGTYTLTFRAKATAGTPTLSYSINRNATYYLNSSVTPTVNATPNVGWTNYSFSFSPSETGVETNGVPVNFTATNGTVLLEDVALTEAPAGGNPTTYRNAVYQRLLALHPGTIRFMGGDQWGCGFDAMISTAETACGSGEGNNQGTPISVKLQDFLLLAASVGADAWWTFSYTADATYMANMAAYFNAPCSSGNSYATNRCNFLAGTPYAGMTWPQALAVHGKGHIYLEYGNEAWNFGNGTNIWENGGTNYGTALGQNVAAFKASPYYTGNMKIVADGFIAQAGVGGWNEGVLTAAVGHEPDMIDGAPYLYGTTTDTSSTAAIYLPMWAESTNFSLPTGWNYQLQNYAKTTFGVDGAIYETNCCGGTGITGITQAQIDQMGASTATAINQTLMMLLAARDAGIKVQNFYSLANEGTGYYTAPSIYSNATLNSLLYLPEYGMSLYMPGPGSSGTIDRPAGITMQMVNTAIGNNLNLLNTVQTGTPTYSQVDAQANPGNSALVTGNTTAGSPTITNVVVTAGTVGGGPTGTITGPGIPANTTVLTYNSGAATLGISQNATATATGQNFINNQYQVAANPAVPYVQAFGFGDGAGNYSLIVDNLNLTTNEAITFSGAAAPPGSCTKTVFGSPTNAIGDNNETVYMGGTPVVVQPTSTSYNCGSGGDTLPPYSMTTYTWSTGASVATASVTSSLNPAYVGQAVTFTATLTGTSAAPTGSVTFVNGSTAIGTATLTTTGSLTSTATLTTSALPAGTDAITVTYGGTTSPVLNQVVNLGSITAAVVSSQNPSAYGQSTTLTATLTGNYAAPTGPVVFMDGATAIATVSLTAGSGLSSTAALTTSTLPVGADPITANYSATSDFNAATSPVVSEVVNPAGTTATVISSLNPASVGQSITLTATLTSAYAAPTGSVTFQSGGATIGTGTLNPTGSLTSTATFTTSSLPVGADPITAVYSATSNFGGSTSAALSQVVNPASTTATITTTLTPSNFDQSVTLVATVASGYATPTGSVTFMDGSTAIGSAILTPGGGLSSSASLATSALPLGTDSITVVYAATTNFGGSTSAVLTQVVQPASSTTTVASSLNPAGIGQPIILTATVSSGYAAPTGSVTFMDGSTAIGSATLTPGSGLSSTATLSTSTLPTGSDSITAVYAATTDFGGSTSAALIQVVNPASTTATVTSSVNPASLGQSVTLTATVSSGYAAPTGSVTFSATSGGSTATYVVPLSPGSGLSSTATLTTALLPAGTDSITVIYGATTNFAGSTSAVLNQVVNPASTTTTVTSSANPASTGQSVILTATVSSSIAAPTGSVTFKNGAASIGTATLSAGGGLSSTATLAITTLPGGTDSITAVYIATPNFGASTSPILSQVINAPATTATVASSQNPSSYNQPVAFTATLTSSNAAPTGSVTFMDGSTTIGSGTLASAGGLSSTATLITPALPVGTDSITVVYAATPNFGGSTSSALSQVVNPDSATATVASSLNPSSSNQPVTLTATLSGSYAAPTGSVTFMDGANAIGTATLTPGGGLSSSATLTTSTLPTGTDPITVVYAATQDFAAATSAVFSQVVNPATSTTATVTSSVNPAGAGQSVTLTATLVGLFAAPTGSVTFMEGSTVIGSGTLTATGSLNSAATLVTSALPVGTNPITAIYAATANFGAATSATFNQVVNLAGTTATVAASLGPSLYGQAVTFTATLSSSNAAPTGSVTFMDGTTAIGTATLIPGSGLSSTAILTTSALPVGNDPITVVYAATANFGAATSAAFNEIVNTLISATALAVSPNPASAGQTVTLTAAVGGSLTIPSGSVTFYNGSTSLGSGILGVSGTASITIATLPVGSDNLTAVYSGNATYAASTSPAVSETIQAASQDFTVALANPNVSVATQNNVTTSVALSSVNGFADTVNLSCGSLPTYITCSLTPSTASLAANSTAASVLYIDTDSVLGYARNGSAPLGPVDSPSNLALMLSPMGLFAGFAAYPTRKSKRSLRLRLFVLFLLAAVPMSLAFSGCASPSVVPLVTPPSAAVGTYTIPITATGATTGISHTVQLTLTVSP